jgi:hAT family C-terminal dimerisation region
MLAMLAECERVFSSAKKMMAAERNRLAEDIIQACERLKVWWDNGIME